MRISVVIPTHGRPGLLFRCLQALRDQEIDEPFEVIVVDDAPQGSKVPELPGLPTRVAASGGRGPAVARNTGVAMAAGEIILFTDDDTRPDPRWIRSAVAHLDAHPDHVGVEGPTRSPAFDLLYEHSVHSDGHHAFLTCNIAYRRAALLELESFFEGFPYPHCEDLDLGFRALELGPVGHSEEMVVVHPPRPVTANAIIRRGRYVASELDLFARHPDRYLKGGSTAASVAAQKLVMRWARVAWRDRHRLLRSPSRVARFAYIAVGQSTLAAVTLVRVAARRGSGRPLES